MATPAKITVAMIIPMVAILFFIYLKPDSQRNTVQLGRGRKTGHP